MPTYPAGAGINWLQRLTYLNRLASGPPVASTYYSEVMADSPSAFWLLNDSPVGSTEEVASRTLTVGGNLTHSTATPFVGGSGSATFDAANDFATAADNDLWSATNFTISGWFRFTDATPVANQFLLCKGTNGNSNCEYRMRLQTNGILACEVQTTSGSTSWLNCDIPAINFADATWVHIAMTLDNATTTLKGYVNGVEKASDSTGSGARNTNKTGLLVFGNDESLAFDYGGQMFGLAYFPTALSAERLLAHATSTVEQ